MQTQSCSLPAGTSGTRTDLYIEEGRVGRTQLQSACYSWGEVLHLAAVELWRRGEAESARVTLKARRVTVRQFLGERFGIVTGPREYFWDSWMTPDRADLKDFLRALRDTKLTARPAA